MVSGGLYSLILQYYVQLKVAFQQARLAPLALIEVGKGAGSLALGT